MSTSFREPPNVLRCMAAGVLAGLLVLAGFGIVLAVVEAAVSLATISALGMAALEIGSQTDEGEFN